MTSFETRIRVADGSTGTGSNQFAALRRVALPRPPRRRQTDEGRSLSRRRHWRSRREIERSASSGRRRAFFHGEQPVRTNLGPGRRRADVAGCRRMARLSAVLPGAPGSRGRLASTLRRSATRPGTREAAGKAGNRMHSRRTEGASRFLVGPLTLPVRTSYTSAVWGARVAQWQRNRFVIGRLVGSNPLSGYVDLLR